VHINNITTNRSLVSTSNDFTTCDLYIESLKESPAAAREYVAKERTPTLDKPDPANLLCIELDTQSKQFKLIMQQNSALQAATTKVNGGSGGGGGGGRGGGSGGGSRSGGSGGSLLKLQQIGCPQDVQSLHTPSKQGQDSYLVQAPQIGVTGTGGPQYLRYQRLNTS
jgi:hypothetical protein